MVGRAIESAKLGRRVAALSMVLALILAVGCSKADDSPDTGAQSSPSASNDASGTDGDSSSNTQGGDSTTGSANDASGSDSTQGSAGASGADDASGGDGDGDGASSNAPPPEVVEMLDPDTDWTALQIVFPVMYSAYDGGVHLFQVPARVDGVTVELSDWQAIPASAASFDPDPEGGGVIITVQAAVPEITIAVSSGPVGGTAPLYVTEATPEQWELGEARYRNGVDYMMPMINFLDLFDPNYVPPDTPDDLACNNCHTTGAKYFEIQHTSAQIGYISDEDLATIFTMGIKPEGVTYSLLPPQLEYLYPEFHTWDAGEEEIKGLIVYLRSLTPELQGEIVLPDTFVLPMQ